LVTWVPLLDTTAIEHIGIELNSNKTTNGVFTYSTEDDTSIVGTKWAWYIGDIVVAD
jgi:cell wall assembly regulator SMI1